MSIVGQGPNTSGLVNRVKNILFTPNTEWDVIETEPATVQGLYTGYICILAAIGPLANLIGSLAFGSRVLYVVYHPNPIAAVVQAIVQYILALVGAYLMAVIIDALAPSFGGEKNRLQALKVVAYSFTAAWLFAVFALVPPASPLAIIGAYSLYLMYLGLPKLMKAPQDKAIAYTAVSVVVCAVVYVVIGAVSGAVLAVGGGLGMGMASLSHPAASTSGTISVNGTSVDLGKLEAASRQMAAAANQAQAGASSAAAVQAVPSDTLKGMLPPALPAGYARSEVSSSSGGVGGLQGSNAEGVYTKGESRITLTVTDIAAAGAFAALGSAFGVQSDRETANGYEKVHMVDGHMVTEEWDNSAKSGKYGVMVANRFIVQAEGAGAQMDDLKAAVAAVGPDKLAGLAKG